jgi:MFS family permease
VIFAPFNSLLKNTLGSKNTIIVGFAFLTMATFGLGAIALYENPRAFYWTAIGLRFIQGAGDVFLQITCYSVITTIYSD